ncbi:MAG TPA: DNA-binding response regulator [Sporichthyaceae bacterium]|jgi:two-component system response regulator DesR|nr:DNA-binding response regulator [Sporichthyaceae bacterium]
MTQERSETAAPTRSVRVLMVQPDRRLADALERRFIARTAVDVAFDGSTALAKAAEHTYDVVVLDQDLPRSQPELSPQRLRTVTDARILLLTTRASAVGPEADAADPSHAIGADEYLSRPFAVPELAARITALAGRKGGRPDPTATKFHPRRPTADVLVIRPIRVLIAEGIALYAGALHTMLSAERDMDVVATVLTDSDLASAATRTRADIALLDLDTPGRDGLGLCRQLSRGAPHSKVIAMTGMNLPLALQQELRAHAHGLVNKHSVSAVLVDCIRRVAGGERVVDSRFTIDTPRSSAHTLTLRELELLRHAASGNSVRELAEKLSLSQGTVRNYLSRIMTKLGARNRIEAIRIARDAGWL